MKMKAVFFRKVGFVLSIFVKMEDFLYMLMMLLMYQHCQAPIRYIQSDSSKLRKEKFTLF